MGSRGVELGTPVGQRVPASMPAAGGSLGCLCHFGWPVSRTGPSVRKTESSAKMKRAPLSLARRKFPLTKHDGEHLAVHECGSHRTCLCWGPPGFLDGRPVVLYQQGYPFPSNAWLQSKRLKRKTALQVPQRLPRKAWYNGGPPSSKRKLRSKAKSICNVF